VIDRSNIGPDTPLRLKTAVAITFPDGGMTVSGLRREAAKGHLMIETIAGKQFTTLNAIREMRERCRNNEKGRDYGSSLHVRIEPEKSSSSRSGSSAIEKSSAALAAARAKLRTLKESSGTTSTPSQPNGPATVTHLPSSSRT
jgi:hypothetical protein